jgi:hypothetical protein
MRDAMPATSAGARHSIAPSSPLLRLKQLKPAVTVG